MGVKDLWTILAPIKQEICLADLAKKALAVDLSGWVRQADTTKVQNYVDLYIVQLPRQVTLRLSIIYAVVKWLFVIWRSHVLKHTRLRLYTWSCE